MNGKPLRVLLVEDQSIEAELLVLELRKAGFDVDWQRVENEREFIAALDPSLDVILADFSLPSFGAPRALALLKERNLDVPFIVVSGSITEETAIQVLKNGAADYLLKDRLARLAQAVQRAIEQRQRESAKRDAEQTLRATEERMRFALEASHVGIWEFDVATGLARWSNTLEAQHGLPAGSFGGTFEAFLDRIHPDDRDRIKVAVAGVTREHTDFNVLYRTKWPDGSIHWISSVGRMSFTETGQPARAAGIGLDVNERVLLEDQYRQAQKMEAVGQLAGGVAHDFNNILTAIEGYYQLVAEQLPGDHPLQPDLVQIHHAAQRATSLTQHLLAFGRKQLLEPRVLDLRESLGSIVPMLKRLIGENIAVVVRASEEVGHVRADPGQIEQVVLNLAVNARDAMPEGGTLLLEVADVRLDESDVRPHATVAPGRYVMLAASDTGTGIDRDIQARIFEPFFTDEGNGERHGTGPLDRLRHRPAKRRLHPPGQRTWPRIDVRGVPAPRRRPHREACRSTRTELTGRLRNDPRRRRRTLGARPRAQGPGTVWLSRARGEHPR
ncbi:MAG TPA: PAS domain-containing protein [Vicinamibacterales bacterium]|nr:PAS domain-containing protein [Vicinamibacterales bacterium]